MSNTGKRTLQKETECVRNFTLTYARKRVKLDNERQYKQVPKLVETNHEGKVIMFFESAGVN